MEKVILKVTKNIICLWFCASAYIAGAQTIVSISGKIVDSDSGQPLPYCNCYLKNSNVGTSTGGEGRFAIKARKEVLPDTLQIQFVGYESKKIALPAKNTDFGTVALKPHVTELKSVTVSAKPINWNKVLKTVFDSCIYKAYPSPSVATTYYKEILNYLFEEKMEVALDVLFPIKQKKRRNRDRLLFSNRGKPDESFFVTGLRRSVNGKIDNHPEKMRNIYGIFDRNGLSFLLNNNIYFNKNIMFEKEMEKASYTLERIDTIEGNRVFTLRGTIRKHNKSTEMKICFDPEHHIIYFYEVSFISHTKNGESTETIKYNYRVSDGYAMPLCFSYISTGEDATKGETYFEVREALFSNIRPASDSVKSLSGKDASGKNSFEFQGITYDKEFWDNYTVIE